jgi:hypothetical protein
MKNECLNCSKRYIGCHDTCESYQKFKTNRELISQNRSKEFSKYFSKIR